MRLEKGYNSLIDNVVMGSFDETHCGANITEVECIKRGLFRVSICLIREEKLLLKVKL